MRRRLWWLLVMLAGLALLAGCGESEQDKYKSKMRSITKQLRSEQQQVTGGKSPNTLAEAGTQFQRLQGVFNRLAQRFSDVKPPAKVKDLHQRLTSVVRNFANSLGPPIQAASSGNVKQFQAAAKAFQGQLSSFQAQLATVNSDYKSRGYKLN